MKTGDDTTQGWRPSVAVRVPMILHVSWEVFDKIPDDTVIHATIRKSRQPEHLVKYWAMLGDAVKFDREFDHADDLDAWIRLSIPEMRDEFTIVRGKLVVRLKSIALDQMDQTEFQRFYDKAVELVTERIGRDPETIYTEEEQHARSVRVDKARHRTGT